jgi:hypothetical protein
MQAIIAIAFRWEPGYYAFAVIYALVIVAGVTLYRKVRGSERNTNDTFKGRAIMFALIYASCMVVRIVLG